MSTILEIKKTYHNKINSLDLDLIISRVIKKPREFVLANPNYKLNKLKIENLKLKIARRAKGEPLAYIFGEKEFYGLNFKVNKNTLVPRPETELMVEEILERATHNAQRITLVDVGTGSGCIIITLAKLLKSKLPVTSYQLLASDISKPALQVARQNAKTHKVNKNIKFLHGNLLEPIIKKSKFDIRNSKFVILANLPYLTPKQVKTSPSIQNEPKSALVAGNDGLKYYKELFKQIKKLNSLCVARYVLCEIDPSQKTNISKLIKNIFPKAKITIKKDLKGHDRLVIIKL